MKRNRMRIVILSALFCSMCGCADEIYPTDPAADPTDDAGTVPASHQVPATDEQNPHGISSKDIIPDFGTGSPAVQLERVVTSIQRAADSLDDHGHEDSANAIRTALNETRKRSPAEMNGPRLHVVGLYEGQEKQTRNRDSPGVAAVRVTDNGGPVTLCLCAYEPVAWTVQIDDGVDLHRVIVSGGDTQSVAGLPPGVPVEGRLADTKYSEYSFSAYDRPTNWAKVDDRLKSLTKLAVNTRFGKYGYEGTPFLVGPENPDWVAQMRLKSLSPLYRQAVAARAEIEDRQLIKSTFPMIWVTPGNSGGESGDASTPSIATATVLGPYADSMQPVRGAVRQVLSHPVLGLLSIANDGLVRIDPESGKLTNIDLPAIEPVSADSAMAFNAAENRLYLWNRKLVSVNLDTHETIVHRDDNPSVHAMVWSPADRCLFGLTATYDGSSGSPITELRRFNHRGAELDRMTLDTVIPTSGHRGRTQVIFLDGRLIILAPAVAGKRQRTYVIDPRTGRTSFVTLSRPRS